MDTRPSPTAAGFAALFVGVLAVAAIPMLLLQHDDATGTARTDAASADTVAVPIRMVLPSSATAEGAPVEATSVDGVHLQGQTGPVLSLAFTADESMMAGTDRSGNAHVWNRAGRLLATVTPASGLRISSVSFAPKGQEFVTVSSDGSVRFWPLPSGG